MASRSASAPDLGMCANHPDEKATHQTDGGGVHELISYCAACWRRYEQTRPRITKG